MNLNLLVNLGIFETFVLSRVSPMKNLDFLLRVLLINTPVQLSIFGPKEDKFV